MSVAGYEIRWHRIEALQKPAYRAQRGKTVLGVVFNNWQGWCWVSWLGKRPEGVCDTEKQARRALVAA